MKYYAIVLLHMRDDSWVGDYLPNVTAIVEQHGGTIRVESKQDEGTTVVVELPVVSENRSMVAGHFDSIRGN